MNSTNVETLLYAPGDPCKDETLTEQMDIFKSLLSLKQGLNATNSMILILNTYRQAVFANKAFLTMVNMKDSSELIGKRLGEIIKCIHACDTINDCGTAKDGIYCNAINTILKTMETNETSSSEFLNINTMNGYEQNINLSIYVAPLQVKEEMFYVVSFSDNSDSVKKRILERTFFHDIINTTGVLKGIVGRLKDDVSDRIKPELEVVEESLKYLVEGILAQKDMVDAEDDQLVLEMTSMETTDILKSVSDLYKGHDVTINKTIKLDDFSINRRIYTDQRLLRRILGNMIKNALEASEESSVVTIGCSLDDDKNELIKLWVHNDTYMDDRVKNLVFQRYFSTKGSDRGMGTYSMKLFGETFLKGEVGFFSKKDKGTRFYIKLLSEADFHG